MNNEKTKFLRRKGEEGQAIVLIALFMAILLAAAGLAIDGGDVSWLYRDAQNAADAAAMAGAWSYCYGYDYEADAIRLATENGFTTEVAAKRYFTDNVVVELTTDSASNNFEDVGATVRVTITATAPAYFIQVVYLGDKTIEAVGEWNCTPSRVSPALMALSETCQYALNTNTSSIFVMGDVVSNGGMNTSAGSTTVNGTGLYLGDLNLQNTDWDTEPTEMSGPLEYREDFAADDFAPSGEYALEATAAGAYHYVNGDLRTNPNQTLASGLYYVTGNVSIRGSVDAQVTIVALGSIQFSATSLNIAAYSGYDDKYPNGLLLYSDKVTNCGVNAISLSASEQDMTGMIIAPYGGVNISASDSFLLGGIVGQTLDLHGSNLQIYRDPVRFSPSINGVR